VTVETETETFMTKMHCPESELPHTQPSLLYSDFDGKSPVERDRNGCIVHAMKTPGFAALLMSDQILLLKSCWNFLFMAMYMRVYLLKSNPTRLLQTRDALQGSLAWTVATKPPAYRQLRTQLLPIAAEMDVSEMDMRFLIAMELFNPNVKHLTNPSAVQAARYEILLASADTVMEARKAILNVLARHIRDACATCDGLLSLRNTPCVETALQQLIRDYTNKNNQQDNVKKN
jgi:hypothetical protein